MQSYDTVNWTSLSVTDNSGAVKTFTVDYNLKRPVTRDMTVKWTAGDHAGNGAEPCVIRLHVKGRCSNVMWYVTKKFYFPLPC